MLKLAEDPAPLPTPDERADLLRARRNLKMTRSAQTYVRGSTTKFYEWLTADGRALPDGPTVWIGGDCHYGNLGPIADKRDRVAIQIRDLDQTVIGNPTHDLIRLTLSMASAARGFDLPGATTARMVEAMVEGYQKALTAPHRKSDDRPPLIEGLIHDSVKRSWRHLARERIADATPSIPLGKRFWPISDAEWNGLKALTEGEPFRRLITSLQSRASDAPVELVDAAYWVKGCSSLGRLRYALIAAVGEGKHREYGLIDVKEAATALAPRAADVAKPRDNAERVVTGARALSPYLGERMQAARLMDKAVVLRELRPQDLKLEIGELDPADAVTVGRFLAGVVGRAHARQMTAGERKHWADELGRNRSKSLDAPSWLWTSIVDLMGLHEAAYLEHCRRYAGIEV